MRSIKEWLLICVSVQVLLVCSAFADDRSEARLVTSASDKHQSAADQSREKTGNRKDSETSDSEKPAGDPGTAQDTKTQTK